VAVLRLLHKKAVVVTDSQDKLLEVPILEVVEAVEVLAILLAAQADQVL
jgi:hypothetical protein